MKIKLIAILLLISAAGFLRADKAGDAYQKMLAAYGKVSSWQASLAQINYFADSKATLTSAGRFYYQKNRLAIRYSKPGEQVLLVSGGKVTIYDKASRAAVKSDLSSTVQSLEPVGIIKSYWQNSTRQLLKSDPGFTSVQLKPKGDPQISRISFTLSNKTGYVTKLTYVDLAGNSVTVAFSGLKVNKAIPASVWKLNLPPGVQVMEY